MAVFYLVPGTQAYIWGGHRLVEEYNKQYDGPVLAETWELSCHPAAPSHLGNGPEKGLTLQEYIDKNGVSVLGTDCEKFGGLPILVKFIDAKGSLSIQVHPDNAYALENEHQDGKTEMWYVLGCEEGAFLYFGFNKEVSKAEIRERIENNTLLEILKAEPVHPGDVFFVEAGTIHAIGAGVLIAEIQQNSNVTYRVYDYGRTGADGKPRELHVEKALDVLKTGVADRRSFNPHIGSCEYFTVDKLYLDGETIRKTDGTVTEKSFLCLLITEGEGTLKINGEEYPFKKGNSLFISAGSGDFEIEGTCEGLYVRV